MKCIFTAILIFATITCVPGQERILDNQNLIDKINHALDLIYNFEFDQADAEIQLLEEKLGNHPTNHFLRSMIIYWRDRPFKVDTGSYVIYQQELETAIELAAPFLEDPELEEEGEFYILAGYGLLTDFYNEAGYRMKAVGSAKKAYGSLKKGFKLKDEFPDFYFSSGVYNYYREKFPELHPFYKAFLWLFVSGDTELGLEQLKVASEKGIFTQREALIYLFHLYLRYENNPEEAIQYSRILNRRFPGNDKFKCLHLEALLYNNDDNVPDNLINSLIDHEKIFYRMVGNLFKGLIAVQNGQIRKARSSLDKALVLYEEMDREYDHYLSLIHTGMARINDRKGDYQAAARMYKEALKNDPYMPVKTEAEDYLERHHE